jgi:ribosomal protein S18 acetylase RimI-like enzyme
MTLDVRPATREDWPAIWDLMEPILVAGETYVWEGIGSGDAERLWMAAGASVFVALHDGVLVGTYVLKPNQPGRGAHVCNAAFMVAPQAQGVGAGRRMIEHALDSARAQGYRAMQFNMVVSTNDRAIDLWRRHGFEEVGRLPKAFRHERLGLVDALIMYRSLED